MSACKTLVILSITSVTLSAQAPAPKPAKPAAAPKAVAPKAKKPAVTAKPAAPAEPEVLTNDSVIQMMKAGLDEDTILAKINSSPAAFILSTDELIRLKAANIPQRVLRAMLGKKSATEPQPPTDNVVKDPGPAIAAAPPEPPPVPPVPTMTDHAIVRQGAIITQLTNKPQKVLFVKSEASDMKSAVANLLLSDVGLQLLTMGMSSQLSMWNPYMGDTISKAANLGKGMFTNKGSETKGFEVETLPGLTADVTLKEGKPEFFFPMSQYAPSANFDPAAVEPVLLRMEPRDKDQSRVLSGRKVLLKQEKKGRFDMKPTTDRQESNVEQTILPVTVERLPDNIIKVTPQTDLGRGEYAIVFRKKDAAGAYTSNVPLKPDPKPADATTETMPGISPEMAAMMSPQQIAAMQQMQQQQSAGQGRGGLFGRNKRPAAPTEPAAGAMTGFLAWDFRVLP